MPNIGKSKRSKPHTQLDAAAVPPPKGLRAAQFEIDGEAYAVLVYPLPTPASPLPANLTVAEAAVVALVMRGFSNEEISATRGSSPRTVANQLQAIYRKLGIGSRVELVRAMAHGISQPSTEPGVGGTLPTARPAPPAVRRSALARRH